LNPNNQLEGGNPSQFVSLVRQENSVQNREARIPENR